MYTAMLAFTCYALRTTTVLAPISLASAFEPQAHAVSSLNGFMSMLNATTRHKLLLVELELDFNHTMVESVLSAWFRELSKLMFTRNFDY